MSLAMTLREALYLDNYDYDYNGNYYDSTNNDYGYDDNNDPYAPDTYGERNCHIRLYTI